MDSSLPPPVQGIVKAFHRGARLVQRVCGTAKGESAEHQLNILQPADTLLKSLQKNQERVRADFARAEKDLGRKFGDGIMSDAVLTNKLQALTINLLEQIDSLDVYRDDPHGFDSGTFQYLQRESERCYEQTAIALGELHTRLQREGSMHAIDDRSQLSSRRISHGRSSFGADSLSPTRTLSPSLREQAEARRYSGRGSGGERTPTTPAEETFGGFAVSPGANSHGSFSWEGSPTIPPQSAFNTNQLGNKSGDQEPKLIDSQEIIRQMAINEEILEKRRRSRQHFYDEIQRLSIASSSISSFTSKTSPRSPEIEAFLPSSRRLSLILMPDTSKGDDTFPELQDDALARESSSGDFTKAGSTRSPAYSKLLVTSSPEVYHDAPVRDHPQPASTQGAAKFVSQAARKHAESSQVGKSARPPYVRFDQPPAESSDRSRDQEGLIVQNAADEWNNLGSLNRNESLGLGRSLKVPGFGDGIDDGKELVPEIANDDPEKMLVGEENLRVTPAVSVQSFDHQINHDASFYKHGGFCEGAKMILRGVGGAVKVVINPGGQYMAHKSIKCIRCNYEIGFHLWELDQLLDPAGIYSPRGIPEIRFRQQLLLKSHLASKLDEPSYACLFCIEDGHTLEDHDATVFFSAAQYFAHLAKHPRPLRSIPGITALYGPQPGVLDFDVSFLNAHPAPPSFPDLPSKLPSRPSARALVNHRRGARGFCERDPEQNFALTFATGAKIVGITYPPRLNGTWACGYHDGAKAYFPASTVALIPPSKDDVSMNPKSGLNATARWDHKHDAKSGWLSFSKKDRITHIGFPYHDFWCWTGMNQRGVWGIFPAAFIEGLVDTGPQQVPIGAASPGGATWGNENSPSSPMGTSTASGERKRSIFGIGGGSKSPTTEKEGHSWGSRLGRSGSHGFGIGRRASGSGGKSPV